MSISFVLYTAGGLLFAIAPHFSHSLADSLLRRLPPLSGWEPTPATEVYNWTVLSVSMMATISACAFIAWRDPRHYRALAVPIMCSKGLSSAAGLLLLVTHAHYAIYLAIFLTDFPLLVITFVLWRRFYVEENP